MDRLQGLKVSIQMIDGRFPWGELAPVNLPLTEKLEKLGLPGPPWRPGLAIFGPLPSIEEQLAYLTKIRDEAQQLLDGLLASSNGNDERRSLSESLSAVTAETTVTAPSA